MSTAVLALPPGLGWSVKRTSLWKTRKQEAISGKRTTLADWSFPRWQWEVTIDFMRQAGAHQQAASFAGATYAEFAGVAGFFNQRQGAFDSFLYQDPDDNTVTAQAIATGDGATVVFPLVRAFGGFVEPVPAPNLVSNVYLNGVPQPQAALGIVWNYVPWPANPLAPLYANGVPAAGIPTGSLVFNSSGHTPGAGVAIAADLSFYFPCQFDDDAMSFEKFMAALYGAKSVKFSSLK